MKEFEIAEYVLPKFEVSVSASKDLIYSDKSILLTVTAKYTFGENVVGTALVSMSSSARPSITVAEKKVKINGIVHVEVPMIELKFDPQSWQDNFDVAVLVTENATGLKYNIF